MIAYFSGTIRTAHGSLITLVVNGVGYAVQVPARYQFLPQEQVELEIHAHMHQENGLQLFGFKTPDEKTIFSLIIGCSGLGPKIGLTVLSTLTPSLVISALLTNDIKTLSSIDGIGRKKAENMVLQLREKAEKITLQDMAACTPAVSAVKQLSDTLYALGYTRQEITGALESVKNEQSFDAPFDTLFKQAMLFLVKKIEPVR